VILPIGDKTAATSRAMSVGSVSFMRLERMNLTPERAAVAESAEFPGRAIVALAADENVLEKSGYVFTTPSLAREYGFTDVNGSQQSTFWDRHWSGEDF
jgi:hypothetical protein